jgi:hypothetical protein
VPGIATPLKLLVNCGLGAGGRSSACETPTDACACKQIGVSDPKSASKTIETAYCFGFIGRVFQTLEIEISSVLEIRTVPRVDPYAADLMVAETQLATLLQADINGSRYTPFCDEQFPSSNPGHRADQNT